MRAVHLDYLRSNRPVPWLGWGVLATALAALLLLGDHYRTLDQRIALWEVKVDRAERSVRQRASQRPLSGQAARAQLQEVQLANQVVRELSLPWNALFGAVESSGGKSIALLSMEPNTQKGTVRIIGEAKDLDALLAYASALSQREVFGNVMLQNHQIRQDDPEKPVRFALLADWKGVAR